MKIKTLELTGAALDWAVAKCEGDDWLFEVLDGSSPPGASHSTDWSLAGPLIEREGIALGHTTNSLDWGACLSRDTNEMAERFAQEGPTPLVAAMRCLVAAKLGDEIEVPEELT